MSVDDAIYLFGMAQVIGFLVGLVWSMFFHWGAWNGS